MINIRGNIDLVDEINGGYLFNPSSVEDVRAVIEKSLQMTAEQRQEQGLYNLKKIQAFDLNNVRNATTKIYGGGTSIY